VVIDVIEVALES